MAIKEPEKSWAHWFEKLDLVLIDPKSLRTIRSLSITKFKVLLLALSALILTSLCAVLLVTQTRLLKLFGNRTQAFIQEDYQVLARKIDTLEKLSAIREKQLEAMQQIITASIPLAKSEKESQEKAKELATSVKSNHKIERTPGPLLKFNYPVEGEMTARFNVEKLHFGMDLVAKSDSRILSIAEGIVIFSRFEKDNGNTVWIAHRNGLVSAYMHNAAILVQEGQHVQAGDEIAIIGNTGESSTGPHLHFELIQNNQYLDPETTIKDGRTKKR